MKLHCTITHGPWILTKKTNSMEQTPWEANNQTASQEIPQILWNPKVHYCVHKGLPVVPILSQMKPVHNFPPYFTKMHSDIIVPSTPKSSKWSLPFRFSDQNRFAETVCVMRLQSHFIRGQSSRLKILAAKSISIKTWALPLIIHGSWDIGTIRDSEIFSTADNKSSVTNR